MRCALGKGWDTEAEGVLESVKPDPIYRYDSAYHQQRRWTHPHSLRCLEVAMSLLGTPQSLLDVGCAEGVHVRWAQEHGVHAVGLDLAVPPNDATLVQADLREPVDLGRQFEWVLCWEVAEHLPVSASDTLVDTLVRHMDPRGRILFTAAGPGQRGPGHINLQFQHFWLQKFADLGVAFSEPQTRILRAAWLKCSPSTSWYGRNVMVLWRVA